MEKVLLITGVAGFLGRHIAREFLVDGWRVIGLDVIPPECAALPAALEYHRFELPDSALDGLLSRLDPTVCIHCAGRASVPSSMTDPASDFRDGPVLTFGLLDALRRTAPAARFLFLSSAAVYGNPATLPVREDHPCAPLSPYGYHKRQSELLCEEFARIYGLRTAVVRIFSAYGMGLRRQVVWDICTKALTHPLLQLRGTGAESRDFIHATDVARALLVVAARARCEGEIYNLASGIETTIADLAAQLLRLLDRDLPVEFDGVQPPGDPLQWRADMTALGALGFAPQVALEEGLRGVATTCAAELAGAPLPLPR